MVFVHMGTRQLVLTEELFTDGVVNSEKKKKKKNRVISLHVIIEI